MFLVGVEPTPVSLLKTVPLPLGYRNIITLPVEDSNLDKLTQNQLAYQLAEPGTARTPSTRGGTKGLRRLVAGGRVR